MYKLNALLVIHVQCRYVLFVLNKNKKYDSIDFSRYEANAKELSLRFHDRPLSPQDTVAYWTEYVLRHEGAPHLKSHAVNTKWYQYFSLDFLTIVIAVITSLLYYTYGLISVVKT